MWAQRRVTQLACGFSKGERERERERLWKISKMVESQGWWREFKMFLTLGRPFNHHVLLIFFPLISKPWFCLDFWCAQVPLKSGCSPAPGIKFWLSNSTATAPLHLWSHDSISAPEGNWGKICQGHSGTFRETMELSLLDFVYCYVGLWNLKLESHVLPQKTNLRKNLRKNSQTSENDIESYFQDWNH